MRREPAQVRRQFDCGLSLQLVDRFGRVRETSVGSLADAGALLLNPEAVLFGEDLGIAPRTPSGNRDSDTSVAPDADNITTGTGMADDFHVGITIVGRHGF